MKVHIVFIVASFCFGFLIHSSVAEKNGKLFLGFNIDEKNNITKQYEMIANDFNAGWIRIWESWWPYKTPDEYYVSFIKKAAQAKAYGFKVLALCHGTHPQYSGVPWNGYVDYPPLPQYHSLWGEYCAGFAQHGADAIEIWNEPNLNGFWKEGVNMTSHLILANLTINAYKAIKKVNPDCIVVSGSLVAGSDLYDNSTNAVAHNGLRYIERLFTVPGFNESFDAFGCHPYVWDNGLTPHSMHYRYNMWKQLPDIAKILEQKAGGKPMWFSEFGAPSNYSKTTMQTHEKCYQEYIGDITEWKNKNSSIGVVFVWQFSDRNQSQYFDDAEGYFGLYSLNFTAKPSANIVLNWANQEYTGGHFTDYFSSSSDSTSQSLPVSSPPSPSALIPKASASVTLGSLYCILLLATLIHLL